jgi:hypothetical protein
MTRHQPSRDLLSFATQQLGKTLHAFDDQVASLHRAGLGNLRSADPQS